MKTGHDLMGLTKFNGRDEWKRHFEEVLEEHFGPAAQKFDLDFDEIGKVLAARLARGSTGQGLYEVAAHLSNEPL
jgi:hypothetical protein